MLGALLLCFLNPPFGVAERLEVVAQLRIVRRPERLLQLFHARGDRVENATVLAQPSFAHRGIRAIARSEQSLEYDARIVLRHQRQGRRAPRQRAAVCAAVADVARTHQAVVVGSQLQRRELRLLLERLRRNLVHRDAVLDDAVRLLDVNAGQIRA